MSAPTATLQNGLRVANFSSPHPFTFDDGTVLDACDPARVKAGSLDVSETSRPMPGHEDIEDVRVEHKMSDSVLAMLLELQDDHNVDVILVPLPVLLLVRNRAAFNKCRGVRIADRQTKTVCSGKFCI